MAYTYKEKMQQANREARFAVISLVATIIVWIALGYGLEGCGITLWHTPLWIFAGCVGTWFFCIGVTVVFSKFVVKDCSLDDDDLSAAATEEDASKAGEVR